jgi:hypothetical protein
MINFFHNGGGDPNFQVEKDAERRPSYPKRLDRSVNVEALVRFRDSKPFRYLLCPAVLVVSILWWSFHPRAFTLVPLFISLALWGSFFFGQRPLKSLFAFWLLVILTTFLPFDVSLAEYPGPPRFVRVIYGLPSDEAIGMADRERFSWEGVSHMRQNGSLYGRDV